MASQDKTEKPLANPGEAPYDSQVVDSTTTPVSLPAQAPLPSAAQTTTTAVNTPPRNSDFERAPVIMKREDVPAETSAHGPAIIETGFVTANKAERPVPQTAELQDDKIAVTGNALPTPYQHPSFGKVGVQTVPMSGIHYHVDYKPLPSDETPFREPMPSLASVVPIRGINETAHHENATVYYYNIPQIGLRAEDNAVAINDYSTLQHMPCLSVLHSNIAGVPVEPAEIPLIMSSPPPTTTSYVNAVQSRFNNGCVDLRFCIHADDRYDTKEIYNLGRIWTPYSKPGIVWGYTDGNWDAVDVEVSPAFLSLLNLQLNSTRDLASLSTTLKFTEPLTIDISHKILKDLHRIADFKLGLSRLYWRLWVLYIEALYQEKQHKTLVASEIYHQELITAVRSGTQLCTVMKHMDAGVEPFFISENILEWLPGVKVMEILVLATATSFKMPHVYGLSECLPPLGRVKVIVPNNRIDELATMVSVEAHEIIAVLRLLGGLTGQYQLIEEIGRTVATMMIRPEGDAFWLGHDMVKMDLPYFKPAKSFLFQWVITPKEPSTVFKKRELYKLSWIGALRYLMISLAANTVLTEWGLFTVLQMERAGVAVENSWYRKLLENLGVTVRNNLFNKLILRVGLRCQWGIIMNRALASIQIISPILTNFTKLSQWSDWLFANRECIEGTFMASTMCHIKVDRMPELGIHYVPAMLGPAVDDADIFYRIMLQDIAPISLRIRVPRMEEIIRDDIVALNSVTGLPLDGQFRRVAFGTHLSNWFSFHCDSVAAVHEISRRWAEKREYTWRLCMLKTLKESALGAIEGEDDFRLGTDTYAGLAYLDRINDRADMPIISLHAYNTVSTHYGNNLVVYGHGDHEASDHESHYDTPTRQRIAPIQLDSNETQAYPIHYCDSSRPWTLGERFWYSGCLPSMRPCGTNMSSVHEAALYAAHRKAMDISSYVPPKVIRQRHRRQVRRDRASSSQYESEMRDETGPDTTVESLPPEVQPSAPAPISDRFVTHSVLEAPNKKKHSDHHLPELRELLDSLEYWYKVSGQRKAFKNRIVSLLKTPLGVSAHTAGSSEALRNRVTNMIHDMDLLDLRQELIATPLTVRAESTRCYMNALLAVSGFVPSTNTLLEKYNRMLEWFRQASRVLAEFPMMTIEECEEAGVLIDASTLQGIGLRDIRDELAILQQSQRIQAGDLGVVQQVRETVEKQLASAQNPQPEVQSDFRLATGGSHAASIQSSQPECHTVNSIEEQPPPDQQFAALDQNLSASNGEQKTEHGSSPEPLPSHARPTVASLAATKPQQSRKGRQAEKKGATTQAIKFEKS